MTPPILSEHSFTRHLRRTHIFILIQFAVSLAILLTAITVISVATRHHFHTFNPLVETVNALSKAIDSSMQFTSEWLFTGKESHRERHQELWDKVIYPEAEKIVVLSADRLADEAHLLHGLQQLQIEQYIITDLAHMPGNIGARDLYERRLRPLEHRIFAVTSDIIATLTSLDTAATEDSPSPDPLLLGANVRAFITQSNTSLGYFILTGNRHYSEEFAKELATTLHNLEVLVAQMTVIPILDDQLSTLKRLIGQYRRVAHEAITLRQSPRWNEAGYIYQHHLLTTNNDITNTLDQLLKKKSAMTRISSERLIHLTYAVVLICSLLAAISAFFLIRRGQQDLATGREMEAQINVHTEELERLSRVDQLTGLFNRRALTEMLDREVMTADRSGMTFCLVYFDIDRFKEINDRQGHLVGDAVLKHIGTSLRQSLRNVDIPCRFGGDEFCVILPGCSGPDAVLVCEKLIENFKDRYPGYSLSIGISESNPANRSTAEEMIRSADTKMYQAKKHQGYHIQL